MKHLIIGTILFVCSLSTGIAQTALGGGLALLDGRLGLQARYQQNWKEQIDLSANFNYFLGGDVSIWSANLDAHYLLLDSESIALYPLAGFNLGRVALANSSGTADIDLGINLGGGLNFALNETIRLFGEIKYVLLSFDQVVFNVGVLLPL